MASPQILNQKKKKKINTESQKMNQSRRWSRPCQRNQTPILLPIQRKSAKLNQTPAKQNQTQTQSNRGVYLKKKKKIPNTKTKTKPQQTKPRNPQSRRRDAAARRRSPLIADRRS